MVHRPFFTSLPLEPYTREGNVFPTQCSFIAIYHLPATDTCISAESLFEREAEATAPY